MKFSSSKYKHPVFEIIMNTNYQSDKSIKKSCKNWKNISFISYIPFLRKNANKPKRSQNTQSQNLETNPKLVTEWAPLAPQKHKQAPTKPNHTKSELGIKFKTCMQMGSARSAKTQANPNNAKTLTENNISPSNHTSPSIIKILYNTKLFPWLCIAQSYVENYSYIITIIRSNVLQFSLFRFNN